MPDTVEMTTGNTEAPEPNESTAQFVEGSNGQVEHIPEGLDYIPEQFRNITDPVERERKLAESYAEAQKKITELSQNKDKEEEPAKEEAPPVEDAAKEAVEKAGLDYTSYSQEIETTGGLSEESYAALEKGGFPRELVDSHIAGVQAQAQLFQAAIDNITGGQDNLNTMIEWATTNLPEAEKTTFNKMTASRDYNQLKMALENLTNKYTAANGTGLTPVMGSTNGASLDVFESQSQVVAAMKDPRYAKDPAYRRKVEQKLDRSDVL